MPKQKTTLPKKAFEVSVMYDGIDLLSDYIRGFSNLHRDMVDISRDGAKADPDNFNDKLVEAYDKSNSLSKELSQIIRELGIVKTITTDLEIKLNLKEGLTDSEIESLIAWEAENAHVLSSIAAVLIKTTDSLPTALQTKVQIDI